MFPAEVFDELQFLSFTSTNSTKTVYALSVVSYYSMRTHCAVHRYGQEVANAGNIRRKNEIENLTEKDERIYLGFYWLKYCDVLNVRMKFYELQINWRPEKGCKDHFHIEMRQGELLASKSEKSDDRLIAIHALWNLVYGPCKIQSTPQIAEWLKKFPERRKLEIGETLR